LPEIQPVLIVTGASSGIGEAAARLFARRGYRVVLAARRFERLQSLSEEIGAAGGEALPIGVDVTSSGDIQNLVHSTLDRFGRVDVLLNNAGMGRMGWLDRLAPEGDIERQIRVNLVGAIEVARAVLPPMLEQGSGHIINMSSIAGWIGTPTYSVYAASKFGLRGFTEALRREVAPAGIHVSGIYPGGVETEFAEKTGRRGGMRTPAWMRLSAEQVAQVVWNVTQRPRREIIIPWSMRLAVSFNLLFPGVLDRLLSAFSGGVDPNIRR
jgi:short-subunit dehydrogenase